MKYLAQSFEDAVVKDDFEKCKRLRQMGCSLDISMPSCHGCSPLVWGSQGPVAEVFSRSASSEENSLPEIKYTKVRGIVPRQPLEFIDDR